MVSLCKVLVSCQVTRLLEAQSLRVDEHTSRQSLYQTMAGWRAKMVTVMLQLAIVMGWLFGEAQASIATHPARQYSYEAGPPAYNLNDVQVNCEWGGYVDYEFGYPDYSLCLADTWTTLKADGNGSITLLAEKCYYYGYINSRFTSSLIICCIGCYNNIELSPMRAPAAAVSGDNSWTVPPPTSGAGAPPPTSGGGRESKKSISVGAIVGAVLGAIVATVVAVVAGIWCVLVVRQKLGAAEADTKDDEAKGSGGEPPRPQYDPPVPANVQIFNVKAASHVAPHPRVTNEVRVESHQNLEAAYSSEVRRYSYKEVSTMSNNWEYELGKGGFGTVYYGEIEETNGAGPQQVALKRLSATSQQGKDEFLNEVRLLSRIHHRYLVPLMGFCDETNNQVLVYEYVQEGSLADWLHGAKQGHPDFNWYYRLLIAYHAALGLEYLHVGAKPNIIHRDVKSGNILITKDWEGRVADFGLSKTGCLQSKAHVTTLVKGTPGYLDPEYFRTSQLTTKSDVYSFGVVLLELVTGRPPIDVSQEDPQLRSIINYVQSHYPYKLANIVDPNLHGNYDMGSLQKIVYVALRSVALGRANRPSMSNVVAEIRTAMKMIELENPASTQTQDYIMNNIVAEISRSAGPGLSGAAMRHEETDKTPNIPR